MRSLIQIALLVSSSSSFLLPLPSSSSFLLPASLDSFGQDLKPTKAEPTMIEVRAIVPDCTDIFLCKSPGGDERGATFSIVDLKQFAADHLALRVSSQSCICNPDLSSKTSNILSPNKQPRQLEARDEDG